MSISTNKVGDLDKNNVLFLSPISPSDFPDNNVLVIRLAQ